MAAGISRHNKCLEIACLSGFGRGKIFPEALLFGKCVSKMIHTTAMEHDKRKRFEESTTEHLREEGIYGDVEATAMKRVIAAALMHRLERRGMTVSELAASLGTSRAAVNRVLDPLNTSLTLQTLARTAAALGCRVKLEIVVPRE